MILKDTSDFSFTSYLTFQVYHLFHNKKGETRRFPLGYEIKDLHSVYIVHYYKLQRNNKY